DTALGGAGPTGVGLALRGPVRAGAVQRLAGVPSVAPGFRQPRVAGASGPAAGGRPRRTDPGPHDVPTPAAALARPDRAPAREPPLRGHQPRAADRVVLHPQLCPYPAAGVGRVNGGGSSAGFPTPSRRRPV